eukprot:CAMPEP_0119072584 /NCGR_PEP_ID=MMETSP1178-20130426/58459_1 /TAXON_ID=33656 /ORGANISM="unid sp, Strain CCMP2000" /LENGTH=63 /DNA_ID=CAMNT_0007054605 /DNA_START=46 /DNA_END=237 /DNA_ORIENTATION=-
MASILDTIKGTGGQINPFNKGKKAKQEEAAKIVQKTVRGNAAREEVQKLKDENRWCKCFKCVK